MSRPVDAVIQFLEAEQKRGVTHVLLDDEAREGLRELFFRIKAGVSKPRVDAGVEKSQQDPPAADVPTPAVVSAPEVSRLVISGNTAGERIASLRSQAEGWPPARSLGSLRPTLVFSAGNPDARILFVGEAPGYEEEKQRVPFVGTAGAKLGDILRTMGLTRDDVYLTNVVKFRPLTPRQTTNNRKPSPAEIAACLPLLDAEIGIVRPDCIVVLGTTAAEALLGEDRPFESLLGGWYEYAGVPVRVTYHPGHLLRKDTDLGVKRVLWEDMLAVMDRLEMPVSAKQRGFFLPKS